MATLRFTTQVNDAAHDVDSVVLCDPTSTFGLKRDDTGAIVVAANTPMTRTALGTYEYDFTEPSDGIEYTYWVKWTYNGETNYNEVVYYSPAARVPGGATLMQAVYQILVGDAEDASAGKLGDLLGYDAVTKPRCVFYAYPPVQVNTPVITYRINGETGWFPRSIFLDVTVWGGDWRAIQDRVYALLNERLQVATTDWLVKGILYESSGPELWDENLKCYFQRARYRIVTIRA